jgi:hypothetical protein
MNGFYIVSVDGHLSVEHLARQEARARALFGPFDSDEEAQKVLEAAYPDADGISRSTGEVS